MLLGNCNNGALSLCPLFASLSAVADSFKFCWTTNDLQWPEFMKDSWRNLAFVQGRRRQSEKVFTGGFGYEGD